MSKPPGTFARSITLLPGFGRRDDFVTFNSWIHRMKKLITTVCVSLFALGGGVAQAADAPAKAADAKAPAAKEAAKPASAAAAASAPAKKKEKKGGC
jgi:hypothetical protein